MLSGFEKLFDAALKASDEDENKVTDKVMELRSRGYDPCELVNALEGLKKKLIADTDIQIVSEAIEEIEGWCKR